ncbi:TnsA endonuclease N-terminal domain-containing protein [Kordiimonas laminariae]|uniref:TnsA endonuclease N-terminal domain-containing protein n=1 Tax=Kordiimonas laminariae TaxID=2917717 RepID=UPI001FF46AD7|nr:TnsA endonuclease N-terminal domain-containing protein [Kordiimonas laminariae]MCK0069412.1 TnsA endonuclease N-terminal domain-containing protein [Kordiimonas laminariae]
MMLEFHKDVLSYAEQPKTFQLIVNGQQTRYTPDFLVQLTTGQIYEEIKPSKQIAKYAAVFDAFEATLADEGTAFAVLTENEIRIEPFLPNIRYLLKFRSYQPPASMLEDCIQLARGNPQLPLSKYERLFAASSIPNFMAYWLLSEHYFSCDLHTPLTPASLLTLKGHQ